MTDDDRHSVGQRGGGSSAGTTGRRTLASSVDSTSENKPSGVDQRDCEVGDVGWTPQFLVGLREHQYQPAILAVAAIAGLAVAVTHWLGLFVAGVLVGLVSRTVLRAVAAGLAIGLLVLLGHVLMSPVMSVGEFLALTPPAYVTIAAALVAPTWGSLARGVV